VLPQAGRPRLHSIPKTIFRSHPTPACQTTVRQDVGGLAGQPLRMSSTAAMTDCILLHIEQKAMMQAMASVPKLSAMFLKYLLKRNIRYQDDLVDQLFNSSEKRLARVLLLMAHFGTEGVSEMSVPRLSQETLAEMVGTTRSRISFFMNRFKKMGFIKYATGDNLHIRSSLLNVLLRDDDGTTVSPGDKGQTAHAKRRAEPPPEPGETADKNRAGTPPLPQCGALILCSSPPNCARLRDLGTCSRALTARLSTLPHRFTFGFRALCRTG
jgi:predicted XRE-type DNA-binding protein